ncbi:hypothetical protein D3C87_101440 [compost metagenome]
MFKKSILFLASVVMLGAVGCSSGEEKLKVSVIDDTAYLIPATVKSCKAKLEGSENDDVQTDYFQFAQVTFNWTDPNSTFYFAAINMTFESPYMTGTKSFSIAGDELAALAPAYSTVGCVSTTPADILACDALNVANHRWSSAGRGTLAPGQTLKISCPLTGGGVKGTGRFSATGAIKIFGFSMNTEGQKTPVETQGFVTIQKIIDN